MEIALIAIACFFGVACILTLGMIGMVCFFALRELLGAKQAISEVEETGVTDISPRRQEPSSAEEYEQRLAEYMADVEVSEEDIIAGLSWRK